MTKTRALIAIGGVILASAAGCEEPGVAPVGPKGAISVSPVTGVAGTTSATPLAGQSAGTSAAAAGGSTGNAGGSAGAAGSAGGASGASGSAGSAGAAGSTSPGPCPAGWTCSDLSASGFAATDKDGNAITFGCGNGGLVECNDATVATSCPALPSAICAHLDEIGVISCTQLCTP